jgi:hypothetical protein
MKETHSLLAPELNEISGIERVNDTLLVAHNDGGNEPIIYFLTQEGTIVHRCFIRNANNNDWEDITYDNNGFLYIEDAGNNLNKRTNLSILKLNLAEAKTSDTISAKTIAFSYSDQSAFPPLKAEYDFDCEALFWKSDSLYLVTKSRAKPWHGYAMIYTLPTEEGTYIAKKKGAIYIGKKGWRKDSVTAADATDSTLNLLTYNRVIRYSLRNDQWVNEQEIKIKRRSQTEGLTIMSAKSLLIVAEKHALLGGPFFIKLNRRWI